eukprot:m.28810 g.28810  ORF g.28810 m.28810 type:complete len:255 (-) comp9079_c0_seq1:325-1089(-)
MRFTTCLVLALVMCIHSSNALELRVLADCPRERTITGMAENQKVWDFFDDSLDAVLNDDCNVLNPARFYTSTVIAETASSFLFNVANVKNFRVLRKCIKQHLDASNPLKVKRCAFTSVCRTDKESCQPPVATTATTTTTATMPFSGWLAGATGQSCTTVCSNVGSICNAELTKLVQSEAAILYVAAETGIECEVQENLNFADAPSAALAQGQMHCYYRDDAELSVSLSSFSCDAVYYTARRFCCCGTDCPIVLP